MPSSRTRIVVVGAAAAAIAALVAITTAAPAFATSPGTSQTFSATGAVQTWTVPLGVTHVYVDVAGAQGGASYGGGGAGAELTGTLSVTPGETLNVVVGGLGANGSEYGAGAGGGGGSFIYTTANQAGLLAAAGGGGGAGSNSFPSGASTGTTGNAGGTGGGAGGTGGGGGGAGTAGGGGGLLTDGGGSNGGQSVAGGASGGPGNASGGFGGGGGTSDFAGGAGGGYSGGGGGNFDGFTAGGGGGGGSYFAGTLTDAVADHGGDGVVTITAPSVLTSISPTHGPAGGGTSVTITGVGFTGASAVHFGSVAATFTVTSDTSITATAPTSPAGAVHVTVTTAGGVSNTIPADRFTFDPAELGATGTDVDTPLSIAAGLLLAGLVAGAFTFIGRRRRVTGQ